jgi:G3E family GTPase
MSGHRTPIVIISGFLGSGKSTLLRSYARIAKQNRQKMVVLLNERGSVNVEQDTMPVPHMDVLGGCLCCVLAGKVYPLLEDMLRVYEPDVIVIECSGVSAPADVLERVTQAALTLPITVAQLVTVVDGARMEDQCKLSGKWQRLQQQAIQCATTIVLGKCDLIAQHARCIEDIRRWNAYAPIVCMAHGACVDDTSLSIPWETTTPAGIVRPEQAVSVHDHRAALDVFCIDDVPMLDAPRFDAWVATLSVFRAKGIVCIDGTWFEWQYAYRAHTRTPIVGTTPLHAVIVCIGEHLNRQHITQSLYAAVAV